MDNEANLSDAETTDLPLSREEGWGGQFSAVAERRLPVPEKLEQLRPFLDILNNEHIGKNMAARRVEIGLTQAELAEKLKCSRSQVAAWENGRVKVYAADLAAIAFYLQTDVAFILGGLAGYSEELFRRILRLSIKERDIISDLVDALLVARTRE